MKRNPPTTSQLGNSPQNNPGLCSMDKCPSVSRSESPLAGICLSESEKAAVLTLIREEVTAGSLSPGAAPRWTSPRGEQGQLCSAWEGGSDPLRGTERGNPSEHIPRVPCLLQPR